MDAKPFGRGLQPDAPSAPLPHAENLLRVDTVSQRKLSFFLPSYASPRLKQIIASSGYLLTMGWKITSTFSLLRSASSRASSASLSARYQSGKVAPRSVTTSRFVLVRSQASRISRKQARAWRSAKCAKNRRPAIFNFSICRATSSTLPVNSLSRRIGSLETRLGARQREAVGAVEAEQAQLQPVPCIEQRPAGVAAGPLALVCEPPAGKLLISLQLKANDRAQSQVRFAFFLLRRPGTRLYGRLQIAVFNVTTKSIGVDPSYKIEL